MTRRRATGARCDSCGADIFWAKTPAGKPIPIDLLPRADGNLVVRETLGAGRIAVPLAKAGKLGPDEVKHVSHFATCLNAGEHRRLPRGAGVRA